MGREASLGKAPGKARIRGNEKHALIVRDNECPDETVPCGS